MKLFQIEAGQDTLYSLFVCLLPLERDVVVFASRPLIKLIPTDREYLVNTHGKITGGEDLVIQLPMFVRHGNGDHMSNFWDDGVTLNHGMEFIRHVHIDKMADDVKFWCFVAVVADDVERSEKK